MSEEKYCCKQMSFRINQTCDDRTDPFDCPDNLIYRSEEGDKYGIIIHDGGGSFVLIEYCPWCGTKLPSPA